jgi:hypothetical protein
MNREFEIGDMVELKEGRMDLFCSRFISDNKFIIVLVFYDVIFISAINRIKCDCHECNRLGNSRSYGSIDLILLRTNRQIRRDEKLNQLLSYE